MCKLKIIYLINDIDLGDNQGLINYTDTKARHRNCRKKSVMVKDHNSINYSCALSYTVYVYC
jgi:hypothetical protein